MSAKIETFSDFALNKQLIMAVEEIGYRSPTPIQQRAIPIILAGTDVVGIAQTGTGKTAAFLLPLLMKVKYAQGKDPRALVIAPTRELALQIEQVAHGLSKYTDLRIVSMYGGIGAKTQTEQVEAGADIIIATPGRFLDIYRKGAFNPKTIKTLVMDEADKMMDMGFMPQIRRILELLPMKKQCLMFSATFPDKVEQLSYEFTAFPERIEVTPQSTAVETVEQYRYDVPNMRTKINLLMHLLRDEGHFSRVIVFVKTKSTANNVFKYLERKSDDEVRVIHANKAQQSRINAIEAFKSGDVRVLVSTDVSARGIDTSMVSHVINFEVPIIYEDYVHRIGRTGRAQNVGVAITFVNPAESYHFAKIEELIREKVPVKPLPGEVEIAPTPFEEKQDMSREIDDQRKRENPDFKGAFHEKKERIFKKADKKKRGRRR